MTYWFSADTHFGHDNIRKYCERPFNNLQEMDEQIIKRWNSRVKPDDTVFFLGDFCFRNSPGGKKGEGSINKAEYYIRQLNGKIIFIRGNHDKGNGLKTVLEDAFIRLGGYHFHLVHNPAESSFNYVLHGHVHRLWKGLYTNNSYKINVGVDVNNFHPINIQEIQQEISELKKLVKKQIPKNKIKKFLLDKWYNKHIEIKTN